jgi:hypothetical protein
MLSLSVPIDITGRCVIEIVSVFSGVYEKK